jgi:HD superfamily phosphohydrolase YqeK
MDILDAIEYHCTGKAHMPPLTKVIYSSDKIDPNPRLRFLGR